MGCGSSNLSLDQKQQPENRKSLPANPYQNSSKADEMMCAPEILHSLKVQDGRDSKSVTQVEDKENTDPLPKKKVKKKLTPEEIKEMLETTLVRLNNTTDYLSEESLADFHFLIRRFSSLTRDEDRSINMHAMEFGIVDLCMKVWRHFFKNSDFMDPKDTVTWTVMKRVLVLMWNGSDRYVEVCERIIELNGHSYCLQVIQDPKIVGNDGSEPTDRQIYTLKGFFGIIHNLLSTLGEPARTAFRDLGAVKTLQGQLNSSNIMVKTKAYINLAYLIDEDQNNLINADDSNIKHIVNILASAVGEKNRYSILHGFSAMETIEALNKLAVNDSNKEKILKAGALKFYEDLLLGDTVEAEKEEVARGLWTLSFSSTCREELLNMPDTMTCLRDLRKSENPKLKKICNGALWIIEERSQKLEESDRESVIDDGGSDVGHIMISYNWGVKPLALKMREKLVNAGFKIWMDVDNMTGSTLEAMADAVEKASVVLICMTQKYKESPSCRTEAEYTYQLRKPFIPLRMEKGYKADGWLGIMIGTRLWFDLIKNFDAGAAGLIKEMHQIGVTGSNSNKLFVKRESAALTSAVPPTKPSYSQWGESETDKWFKDLGVSSQKLKGLDGSLLAEYLNMKRDAPEFFYTSLRDQLKFSLIDILKFTKGLNKL